MPSRAWLAPAALAIALLSLGANAYLLAQLRDPERWAAPALRRWAEGFDPGDAAIRYTVRIPAGTPLRLDIPVDERFSIAVDTVIPINTRVRVPIRTPFGAQSVVLPIRADVPLRTRLPLQVRHTFRLRTRTQQEIAVPLQIQLDELPLQELLERAAAPPASP